MNKRRLTPLLLFLLSLAAGVLMEFVLPAPGAAESDRLLREAAVRLAYAGAAGALCAALGLSLSARPGRPGWLAWLSLGLSLTVALNNLPWYTLLSGAAAVTAGPWAVFCLALSCLATALFEETLFRAFLFRVCLLRTGGTRRGRLCAVLLSSAVFALLHLGNLFAGAAPGAVALQVGYTFLVGCASAVLYLLFGRLTVPLAFHAVYNFGGYLLPRLGHGPLWAGPAVPITVVLALLCAASLALALWRCEGKLVQNS